MTKTTVDSGTIVRALKEEVKPSVQRLMKEHVIFCEGDLQAVVYTSLITFLVSREFNFEPINVANLRFIKDNNTMKGIYPDIIVFYFNRPIYVIELKDNINRTVGFGEMDKDFSTCQFFDSKGVSSTILVTTISHLESMDTLEEKYKMSKSYNTQIILSEVVREHQIGEWKRQHEYHRVGVQRFLDESRKA